MIDDLEEILSNYDPEMAHIEWTQKREAATAAALEHCPTHIKEWLIDCTAGRDGKPYSTSILDDDNVEWFEVGHNATHYFSFGVRSDGVFIKKTNGPEYHKECECWYNRTTVRIISLEGIPKNYWGHQ